MLDFCEKNSVGVIICYFSSDTFIAVAFQGGPKRFNPKQYQFLSLISITLTFEKKNHLSNYRLTASLETKIPTKLKLFSLIWYWIGVLIVCLYWFTQKKSLFEVWTLKYSCVASHAINHSYFLTNCYRKETFLSYDDTAFLFFRYTILYICDWESYNFGNS